MHFFNLKWVKNSKIYCFIGQFFVLSHIKFDSFSKMCHFTVIRSFQLDFTLCFNSLLRAFFFCVNLISLFPGWNVVPNTKSKFLNLPESTWTNLWKYLQPIEWAAMINGAVCEEARYRYKPFKLLKNRETARNRHY